MYAQCSNFDSRLFDFSPLTLVPVVLQLTGANDLCAIRVSAPVWMGDDVIMVGCHRITHSVTPERKTASRPQCKMLVIFI